MDDKLRSLELRYFVSRNDVALKEAAAIDLAQVFSVPDLVIDQGRSPAWGGTVDWIISRKERRNCLRFVWHPEDGLTQLLGSYCLSLVAPLPAEDMLNVLDIKFN
jgi:hypothetical protein